MKPKYTGKFNAIYPSFIQHLSNLMQYIQHLWLTPGTLLRFPCVCVSFCMWWYHTREILAIYELCMSVACMDVTKLWTLCPNCLHPLQPPLHSGSCPIPRVYTRGNFKLQIFSDICSTYPSPHSCQSLKNFSGLSPARQCPVLSEKLTMKDLSKL